MTQVSHMVTQITKLQSQLETAQRHLDSINGSRGYGSWARIDYDTALSTTPADTLKSYEINNGEYWNLDSETAAIYDAENQDAAIYLEQSQDALSQSKARYSTLNGMVSAVDTATDQKDIMDLQARISAEQALLENERIKLTVLNSRTEAQKIIRERQAVQLRLNSIQRTPIDWN
ncbi:MAG: type IV secretion protein [Gammaproteobacteria bacterium]|nr:type IV secretion protein [Gammaproteobacteria bacterium]